MMIFVAKQKKCCPENTYTTIESSRKIVQKKIQKKPDMQKLPAKHRNTTRSKIAKRGKKKEN